MDSEILNQPQNNDSNASFKTALFWRQSLWNSRKSVPIVMGLEDKALTIMTHHNDTFRIPLATLTVKFSRLGTMTLRAEGKSYNIVGRGTLLSPSFTDQQLAELGKNNSWELADEIWRRGLVDDLVAPETAKKSLMARMMNTGFDKGIKVMKQWELIFEQKGILTTSKKSILYKYGILYIGLAGMLLSGLIAFLLR